MKKSASRRKTNLSGRTIPLTPSPKKSSTNTPIRKLGSCSLQRRTKGLRSNCRSRTSSISRGLILFREVNDRFWTSEASTFLDVKPAGFGWQNRRKLHLESADASGVHFDSFTSRKSIRPRFRKGLNVTKEQPFCRIIRSAGLPRDPFWMRYGPAAGQRQPSAAPKLQ